MVKDLICRPLSRHRLKCFQLTEETWDNPEMWPAWARKGSLPPWALQAIMPTDWISEVTFGQHRLIARSNEAFHAGYELVEEDE